MQSSKVIIKIKDIQDMDMGSLRSIGEEVIEVIWGLRRTSKLWTLVTPCLVISVLLYVLSIPMQLVSYYIILLIKYLTKHHVSYQGLLE